MQSAINDIGPHLLGCRPYRDARDVPMNLALDDPYEAAFAALMASGKVAPATKAWARFVTDRLETRPVDPIVKSPTKTRWDDPAELDQGQTPHCVGFSGAGWLAAAPVQTPRTDEDGHSLYYKCKDKDGEPKEENGSSIHSLASVLADNGRVGAYVWATTLEEIVQYLLLYGPVVFGTDWYTGMFHPDKSGLVVPTGRVEGGHAYLALGVDTEARRIEFKNSWSASWGVNGNFFIAFDDVPKVIANQGEAMAGLELAA